MTFTYPSHTTKGCVPLSSDVSELPTNQIFELFDLSNNGKDVSPYKIDYAVNKDILDECQLGAYESLIELNNEVALLYDNGKIVALIGYVVQ